jgi:hypothetical protein
VLTANDPTSWSRARRADCESRNCLTHKILKEGFPLIDHLPYSRIFPAPPGMTDSSAKGQVMRTPLRRAAASKYLLEKYGIERAVGTLSKLAVTGGGPPFSHAGRIPLYDPNDLDQWALSLLSGPVRSNSERRAAKVQPPAPALVEAEEPAGLINTGLAELAANLAAAKRHDSS